MLVVHQPHFLPWLGYFSKLAWADTFVVLDNVKYRRLYFQNRTLIKQNTGTARWFTVPVHATNEATIADVLIASDTWRQHFVKIIQQCYGRTPFFRAAREPLFDAACRPSSRLLTVNMALLNAVLALFQWSHIEIIMASQLSLSPDGSTDRLFEIAMQLDASHVIYGEGGSVMHHPPSAFRRHDIVPLFQTFAANHPVYRQRFGKFVSRLSVIDALFNIGPAETERLIRLAWHPSLPSSTGPERTERDV